MKMEYFKVKNWERFQHYKNRNPPWIKLHYELLSSRDWVTLSDSSRALMVACMLVASRNDGLVPNDRAFMKRVAYLKTVDFNPLIKVGFLLNASTMQADASVSVSVSLDLNGSKDLDLSSEDLKSLEPLEPLGNKKHSHLGIPYQEIIQDLNDVLQRNFNSETAETRKLIRARWNEGHGMDDFKTVHRKMNAAWSGDARMEPYLRPQTLYTGKFDSYLNRRDEPKMSTAGMKAAQVVDKIFSGEEEDAEH